MAAPDDQWEVTGDVPEHLREFIAAEVNAHMPGPGELLASFSKWGQYPPPEGASDGRR